MDSKRKNGKTVRTILLILVCAALACWFIYNNGRRRAVGGLKDPVQTEAEGTKTLKLNGYDVTITYRAAYDIEALVVHRKKYSGSGLGATLSPVDLALAWGKTAECNTQIDFHWKQSGRFYYWHVNDLDELIPVGDVENVEQSSANCHIIPADAKTGKTVKRIRRGDHIRLKGYLVDIDAVKDDGSTFWWHTSTVRTDTGDGACELIYVTDATIID